MSVISSPALFMGEDGYQISRSVRLRSSATAYFNRTLGTPTSSSTWTFSCWIKRGGGIGAGASMGIFAADTSEFYFGADQLRYYRQGSLAVSSTAVYRDPSAWYHVIVNSNGSTVNGYVNNQLSFTYSGTAPAFNTAIAHNIGRYAGASDYFDGYLTEVNFIDGQALTPSSFGENDSITGVWKPKKYAGTYGNNGFYLNFSDNSNNTAATIGKDYSGNGNNWTPNNISVTAGVTYDSMIDTPTPYADGGNGRGNYAVLNPTSYPLRTNTGTATFSDGNLKFAPVQAEGSSENLATASIICPSSGKWYCEVTPVTLASAAPSRSGIGISSVAALNGNFTSGAYPTGAYAYHPNGNKSASPSSTGYGAYGASYSAGDVIGVALDMDGGTLTFYKNNVSQGTAYTGLSGEYFFAVGYWITANINFGQRPFVYTPPTGFKALNTQNLPDSTIKKGSTSFDVQTWSGNGVNGRTITATVDAVDLAWVKRRDSIDDHRLANSVLGGNKHLKSNTTDAEATGTTVIQAFSGSTFTIGSDASVNASGGTYVGWLWKKGATPGLDIVTYSAGSAGQAINHSLGVKPAMMIAKGRNGASSWAVYHKALGATNWLLLNSTQATTVSSQEWSNTEPTSTQFTVGATNANSNYAGGTFVAYLFAEVAGFSKFGSYTGNGSADGPFVYCGFRPRYVMIKRTDSTGYWIVEDSSRNTYNVVQNELFANSTDAEYVGGRNVDFLSNGFKIRHTDTTQNASGGTYIYAAFAENPFKNSLAR